MLKGAVPVFRVSSSRAAEAFYCGCLGFRREFANRPDSRQDDPCYTGLRRDGVRLHISSFPGDGALGGVANLYVEDIDTLHAELVASGARPEMEPTTQTWGTREVYVKDSDGNSVRFVQTGTPVSGEEADDQSDSPMHPRAKALIAELDLSPHPEGGYFREIHRSTCMVDPRDGRPERHALTVIHFLLVDGQVSRWHRVASDEAWHFLEGDPLELVEADTSFDHVACETLGLHGGDAEPVRIISAGSWQAARSTGEYTLASCTVGPGFDYADFEMLDDRPSEAVALRRKHPRLASRYC